MLDQLVESRSGGTGGGRSGFFLTTLLLVFGLFFGMILYSLFDKFANGLGGNEDLELSSLVAPVPVAEDEPPPEPEKQPEKPKQEVVNADVRKEIIQDLSESPQEIDKISTVKEAIPPRRVNVKTIVGDSDSNAANPVDASDRRPVD